MTTSRRIEWKYKNENNMKIYSLYFFNILWWRCLFLCSLVVFFFIFCSGWNNNYSPLCCLCGLFFPSLYLFPKKSDGCKAFKFRSFAAPGKRKTFPVMTAISKHRLLFYKQRVPTAPPHVRNTLGRLLMFGFTLHMQHSPADAESLICVCWKQGAALTKIIPLDLFFFFFIFKNSPRQTVFFCFKFHSSILNGMWHLCQGLSLMQTERQQWNSQDLISVFSGGWIAEFLLNNLWWGSWGQWLHRGHYSTWDYIKHSQESKRNDLLHILCTQTHPCEYPCVIWDYSSTQGGHVQHFMQEEKKKKQTKHEAQPRNLRDTARHAVMKKSGIQRFVVLLWWRRRTETDSEPETKPAEAARRHFSM